MPRMVSHKPERKTMKSVTASRGAARAEESDEAQGWAKHSHLLLISKKADKSQRMAQMVPTDFQGSAQADTYLLLVNSYETLITYV